MLATASLPEVLVVLFMVIGVAIIFLGCLR